LALTTALACELARILAPATALELAVAVVLEVAVVLAVALALAVALTLVLAVETALASELACDLARGETPQASGRAVALELAQELEAAVVVSTAPPRRFLHSPPAGQPPLARQPRDYTPRWRRPRTSHDEAHPSPGYPFQPVFEHARAHSSETPGHRAPRTQRPPATPSGANAKDAPPPLLLPPKCSTAGGSIPGCHRR
jgi:hypothetical protein